MDIEKINELCALMNEKNALITKYHSARSLRYRRLAAMSDSELCKFIGPLENQWQVDRRTNGRRYFKLNKHDRKVFLLEAQAEFEVAKVAVLKWTSLNRKKMAKLKRELDVVFFINGHSRWYEGFRSQRELNKIYVGEEIYINKKSLEQRGQDYIFEQVILRETA